MFSGLRSGTPQEVSCTVRNPFLGTFPRCGTRFGRCETLFWDSRPEDPKSLLAPSLKHFWEFWLFRHLYQASGVATLESFCRLRCLESRDSKVESRDLKPILSGGPHRRHPLHARQWRRMRERSLFLLCAGRLLLFSYFVYFAYFTISLRLL